MFGGKLHETRIAVGGISINRISGKMKCAESNESFTENIYFGDSSHSIMTQFEFVV